MACSTPVFQGQSPALCQFCEVDSKIKWKCIDCDLLLCTKCKDKIHSKVKTKEEHRIIDIKEIGKQSDGHTEQSTRHHIDKSLVGLELAIIQEYTNKFPVHYIQLSMNDSLWIGSVDEKKTRFFSFKSSRHLQEVKLKRNNLKIISSFNVDVRDIAVTPTNDLILADATPKLKQILYNSNKVTESKYCVEPYEAWCIHVTRDNKVVVGALSEDGEGCVYLMDINGVHQQIYRHDHNNKPLFTWPYRITSTISGRLCVINNIIHSGRLVMLDQGVVIGIYTGHPNLNTGHPNFKSDKKPFSPTGVVTTSNDNIITIDHFSQTLHLLNNKGKFLTYYNLQQIGIENPWSLVCTTAGQFSLLYIGCQSEDEKEGKLYKLSLC